MKRKSKVRPVWGADPEFFATYVSASGDPAALPPVIFRRDFRVPVTENGDHPIFLERKDSKVIEDGGAFEMSLLPDTSWENLFDRIQETKLAFSEEVLSRFPEKVNGELEALPTVTWEVNRWLAEGPDFRLATRFGCDPDEDAFWEVLKAKRRSAEFDASRHPERYAGGHIHISGVREIQDAPLVAIKCLALTAGLAAVAFSDVPKLEKMRTFRYGLPGKFRIQRYSGLFNNLPYTDAGVEYRTPSTRWTHSRDLAQKVFEWAGIGIQNLLVEGLFKDLSDEFVLQSAKTIVKVEQKEALNLLSELENRI